MTGDVRTETLGSDPAPRRWPWLARIAVPLLALLAVLAIVGLQRAADDARTALAEGYVVSLREERSGQALVEVAYAYVSPALWRTDLPPQTEDEMWQIVREQADAAADRMATVRQQVEGITLMPWQADHRQARDALVDLVTAQEDRFLSMAQDVRRLPSYLARGPVPDADAARALRSIGATIR